MKEWTSVVKYTTDHIPEGTTYNRRPSRLLVATTITIHNTGNPSSSARNERSWLTNPSNKRQASYHLVVDEHEVIECLPLNENAWHAGDGDGSKSGNCTSIGIEICESGNYAKTLDNAVALVARMLLERGWGVDRLRRHYDWSSKICPRLMYNEGSWSGWGRFKTMVAAKMQKHSEEEHPMTNDEKDQFNKLQKLANAQAGVTIELSKRIKELEEKKPAPSWFEKEFSSLKLSSIVSDPNFTDEGWRLLAIGLRLKK